MPFSSQPDLSPLLVTSTVSISVRGAIVKDIRKRENSITRVCTNEIETRKLHTNLYIQTGI